ncbi:NrfD/PsrC family molybdoenzyme membrane anchor subunit [Corynebacterium tapiri]|uniref:Nitrite reductase n=1 Tax=Corynebacterium tapiri TaxID=1448266 RepID=A0A5C4U8N2_9CORY|nr:NrfD/PsrC family molybdoenzyme membrane anchor subunit [Corynebacterium tapiri]TNM00527.1 nitrite reductase [Corynebacterium tapiri]
MPPQNFDSYRPPQEPRRRDAKPKTKRRRRGAGAQDGSREERMVPNIEFESYYGKPVVKAPPWEWPIAVYLFLGGVAGGSALLSVGAEATGRDELRRNTRMSAAAAAGVGSLALIKDLGRPLRALNMFRVLKASSPMSWGSWLLATFGATSVAAAAAELDEVTDRRFPLPDAVRTVVHAASTPMAAVNGVLGAPLAVYTAVLFGDTSVPAWNEARRHLPFLFVSSAAAASGGLAMLTTPVEQAGPARAFAVLGAAGDVAATKAMQRQMDEVSYEPYEQGAPGKLLHWAEYLVIGGGVAAAVGGKNRVIAALSGAALLGASCLTRFGVLEAGLESTKDPKYVIEPQKRRLAQRMGAGDSITTA